MSINIEQAKNILIKYYKSQLKKLKDNNFSDESVNFLKVKFGHSFECYYIGKKILKKDKELKNKSNIFKERAELSFLLHDIGRFFEITNELNSKPHGAYGADLLENNDNFNDKFVLIAVRHHDEANIILNEDIDYLKLSEEDKKQSIEILKILKDADKISNLYLFKNKNTIYTRKDRRYGFSEEYFEGIKNKHLIDKKYKNTIFDSIAYYIIWFHELFYEGSKEFVIEHKLIDHLINMYQFFIEKIEKIELNYDSTENVLKKKEEMKENLNKLKIILREQNIINQ